MKKIIVCFAATILLLMTDLSASSVYKDTLNDSSNERASYVGIDTGISLSGSATVPSKSCGSVRGNSASITYCISGATKLSLMFYTPIYPTAVKSGALVVPGYNSTAKNGNVFIDQNGNILTKSDNCWHQLCYNYTSFNYVYEKKSSLNVNEASLSPFMFSVYASSDNKTFTPVSYSLICYERLLSTAKTTVVTELSANFTSKTNYITIIINKVSSSLVQSPYCYITDAEITYNNQSPSNSSSSAVSSSQGSVSSVGQLPASSNSLNRYDDNDMILRENIDKEIEISSSLEDEADESDNRNSSSKSSSSSKPEKEISSSSSQAKSSSSSKKPAESKSTSSEKSAKSKAAKTTETEISSCSQALDSAVSILSQRAANANSSIDIISGNDFPVAILIYVSAIVVAGAIILLFKMKKH